MVSCSTSATPATIYNAPITERTVTYDNLCNAAPPANNTSLPSGNTPSFSVGSTTFQGGHLDQTVSKAASIHTVPGHTNYTAPVHPAGPPVSQTSCISMPPAHSAPYRNHTIPTVSHGNQAYTTTPQGSYRPPVTPHHNYANHAMPLHTAPHSNYRIQTMTPRVPYNTNPAAYSSPRSMSRVNHTTYTAHQSNNRGYAMSKPPHGNYSIPTVSTVPGNTVITVPVAGSHNNYTILKIPNTPANVTVLTAAESANSTTQPQSQTSTYRSPHSRSSSSLKGHNTERVSSNTSRRVNTSTSSRTVPTVIDSRRKVDTYGHKKGIVVSACYIAS